MQSAIASPSSSSSPNVASSPPSLVLVVEDDPDVRQMIDFNLRSAGFDVIGLGEGGAAVEVAEREAATLVILDRMLPDADGLNLCREMRESERLSDLAILVLTARGAESDRLDGFAAGADDYVVKPFSVRELVARARVLTTLVEHRRQARRVTLSAESTMFRWRGLLLDVLRHRLTLDGEEIELRPIEFTLLTTFFAEPMRIFSRGDIVRAVWGDDQVAIAHRTVDVHVRRLRERLGAVFGEVIQTIHGVGYRLREE